MPLDVEDMIAGLDPAERRKVEEMANELIAEEMTLRELRKARQLTQASVARELGISQDAISRLEQRSDLLLSTQDRGGDGRQPLARRPLPRPASGRACRHRRTRRLRLRQHRPAVVADRPKVRSVGATLQTGHGFSAACFPAPSKPISARTWARPRRRRVQDD